MAKRIRIFPYKLGSKSATALADSLAKKCGSGVLKVKSQGQYMPRDTDIVFGWGSRNNPSWDMNSAQVFLNKPAAVNTAANKIEAFRAMDAKGVPTVPWTLSAEVARDMLAAGDAVVVRTLISGHGGAGIFVATNTDEWNALENEGVMNSARLYTKYIKPRGEYRVHVVRGEVIDYVKKRTMNENTRAERGIELNKLIRNHDNGWVFARQDIQITAALRETSIKAVEALGLDFGAVDIIDTADGPMVLEINTAPGLEGTTLEKYTEAFAAICGF